MRMLETRWWPRKPGTRRKNLGSSNHGIKWDIKSDPIFSLALGSFSALWPLIPQHGHPLRWLTLCAVSANCWALFFMSSVFSSARPNRSPRSFKAWLAFCTALVTLSAAEWRMLFPGRIARVSRVGLSKPQWQIPTLWKGQSPSSWTQLTW